MRVNPVLTASVVWLILTDAMPRAMRNLGLGLVVCLSGIGYVGAQDARPYQVRWPDGWKITRIPTPLETNAAAPGERVQALRTEDGRPVAVMELMYLPRHDRGRAILEREFGRAVDLMRKVYEEKGWKVRVSPPRVTRLGSHQGLEVDISAAAPQATLSHWKAMAFTSESAYSFDFSAVDADFRRLKPDLEATLESLVLR